MLSRETQRHALLRYQSKEIKILNILFPRVGIEPTTSHVYSHTPKRHHTTAGLRPDLR